MKVNSVRFIFLFCTALFVCSDLHAYTINSAQLVQNNTCDTLTGWTDVRYWKGGQYQPEVFFTVWNDSGNNKFRWQVGGYDGGRTLYQDIAIDPSLYLWQPGAQIHYFVDWWHNYSRGYDSRLRINLIQYDASWNTLNDDVFYHGWGEGGDTGSGSGRLDRTITLYENTKYIRFAFTTHQNTWTGGTDILDNPSLWLLNVSDVPPPEPPVPEPATVILLGAGILSLIRKMMR